MGNDEKQLMELLGNKAVGTVISDIDGKEYAVPAVLPIVRELQVQSQITIVVKNLMSISLPERKEGETDDGYSSRVGKSFLLTLGEYLTPENAQPMIRAAAIILGVPVGEIESKFTLDSVLEVVVPFGLKAFTGMIGRFSSLLKNTSLLSGLEPVSASSLKQDSTQNG